MSWKNNWKMIKIIITYLILTIICMYANILYILYISDNRYKYNCSIFYYFLSLFASNKFGIIEANNT